MRRLKTLSFTRTEIGWMAVFALAGLTTLAVFARNDITTRIDRIERRTTTTQRTLPPTAAQITEQTRAIVRAELTKVVRVQLRQLCAQGRCRTRAARVRVGASTRAVTLQQLELMVRAAVERRCARPGQPCRGKDGRDGVSPPASGSPPAGSPAPQPAPAREPHPLNSDLLDGVDNRATDAERLLRPVVDAICASPPLKRLLNLVAVCP